LSTNWLAWLRRAVVVSKQHCREGYHDYSHGGYLKTCASQKQAEPAGKTKGKEEGRGGGGKVPTKQPSTKCSKGFSIHRLSFWGFLIILPALVFTTVVMGFEGTASSRYIPRMSLIYSAVITWIFVSLITKQ
jgi:hypothetical protein